jgi:hypothetical protein
MDNYIITGRIRDDKNLAVEGYTVQAFDKDPKIYLKPDDRLGSAITDKDGAFKIVFKEEVFKDWLEGGPDIYLVIRDRKDSILITTRAKENLTKRVDFQIKLGEPSLDPHEPDLYANNLERTIASLKSMGDAPDLSKSDVKNLFELLSRTLVSWTIYRDDLVRLFGYDGIQVPKEPRKEKHDHVTRWDKPNLPE